MDGIYKKIGSADDMEVGGDLIHTGDTVGLYGATPVVQAGAYTQTYSTAARTNSAALTHSVGTADGTVDDVGGAFNQTTLNNNFKELTTEILVLKKLINALIDDLQGIGIAT